MVESGSSQELEMFAPPPAREFCFDPKRKLFITSTDDGVKEQNPLDIKNVYFLSEGLFESKKKEKQEDHWLAISPLGTLIEFPNLRTWIANLSERKRISISRKIVSVIETTYRDLNPNPLVPLPKDMKGGMFGFNAILKEDGSFNLSTFGNCACLGKNPYPHFMYCESDRNLPQTSQALEYDLHNIDWPAQELSLYAGAGTIAWLKDHTSHSI